MIPTPATGPELGGVILTGGSSARIDGADKASLELGGVTLLDRALAALSACEAVVVVGGETTTRRPVSFVREVPPGGGPAAGLLAGLAAFGRAPRLVVVLAVDMPMVTAATVRRLLTTMGQTGGEDGGEDGALLVDQHGRRQYLCGVYRTAALLAAAPAADERHGLAVRRLLRDLGLAEVLAIAAEGRDVDTWEDLASLRAVLEDDRDDVEGHLA